MDPKQRHPPPPPPTLWFLLPHLSACLGAGDVEASREWDGCGFNSMPGEITTQHPAGCKPQSTM